MAQSAFWAPFFEPKSPPLLAVSTPLFFKTKDNYIRDFNLNFLDEMPNRPKSLSPPVAWPIWTTWISYSDAEAAMLLTNFFNSAGTSVSLTTGRQIQESDLESHAVVFLGHPRGMPLLNDFLKTRNFYAYQPGPGRSFGGIRNRAPRPGEKEVYLDWGSTSDEIQSVSEMAPDYGLITYSKPAQGAGAAERVRPPPAGDQFAGPMAAGAEPGRAPLGTGDPGAVHRVPGAVPDQRDERRAVRCPADNVS